MANGDALSLLAVPVARVAAQIDPMRPTACSGDGREARFKLETTRWPKPAVANGLGDQLRGKGQFVPLGFTLNALQPLQAYL